MVQGVTIGYVFTLYRDHKFQLLTTSEEGIILNINTETARQIFFNGIGDGEKIIIFTPNSSYEPYRQTGLDTHKQQNDPFYQIVWQR